MLLKPVFLWCIAAIVLAIPARAESDFRTVVFNAGRIFGSYYGITEGLDACIRRIPTLTPDIQAVRRAYQQRNAAVVERVRTRLIMRARRDGGEVQAIDTMATLREARAIAAERAKRAIEYADIATAMSTCPRLVFAARSGRHDVLTRYRNEYITVMQ